MPGKIYITILSFCFLSIFHSCCFTKNISLGGNLKLSEFSIRETEIMYCNDNCCTSGITVIPQTIVAYDFDSNWVIAKSDSTYYNGQNDFAYWIYNKNIPSSSSADMDSIIKSNLIGPIDSLSFYQMLSDKKIHLKLKNR